MKDIEQLVADVEAYGLFESILRKDDIWKRITDAHRILADSFEASGVSTGAGVLTRMLILLSDQIGLGPRDPAGEPQAPPASGSDGAEGFGSQVTTTNCGRSWSCYRSA